MIRVRPTLLLTTLLTIFVVLGVFHLHFQVNSTLITQVQAQGDGEEPSASAKCSVIGNNLANTFSVGAGQFNEADFTLANLNSEVDVGPIISTISSYSGTVIVRVGAANNSIGPDAAEYAGYLNEIAQNPVVQGSGKTFIAMVSHNEPNGAESFEICQRFVPDKKVCVKDGDGVANTDDFKAMIDEVLKAEIRFANQVVAQAGGNSNIQFITGQIDTYFNSAPGTDNSRAIDFGKALGQVDKVVGVSVPLYTTPNFPTGQAALDLFLTKIDSFPGKIFITESGPLTEYSNCAPKNVTEFSEFLIALQKALEVDRVAAALLFNSHGLNSSCIFAYTEPFWNPACREALRNNCTDTEAVLAVCGADITSSSGEHLCRTYCKGDYRTPCQGTTKGNDCSYPIDFDKLLAADVTEEEQRLSAKYLSQYMPRTKVSTGKSYDFKTSIENDQVCDIDNSSDDMLNARNDGIVAQLCSQQEGGGAVFIGSDDRRINSIVDPESDDNLRLNWSRAFGHNLEGDRPEDYGAMQLLGSDEFRYVRLSAILALKEECWQKGIEPIPEYIDNKIYGPSRCMNYQDLGSLGTEREIFQSAPLNVCTSIYHTIQPGVDPSEWGDRTQTAIAQCRDEVNKLMEDNGNLYKAIKRLPDIPIATVPLIAGVDEYGPGFEEFYGLPNLISEILGKDEETEDPNLNFQKSAGQDGYGGRDRLGAIGTLYFVSELPAGPDIKAVNQSLAELVSGEETHEAFLDPDIDLPLSGADFNLFYGFDFANVVDYLQLLLQFFGQPKPFYHRRIPEGFQQDSRFFQVQFALYQSYDSCLNYSGEQLIDHSLNDARIQTHGALGFDGTIGFDSLGTNLTNIIESIKEAFGGAFRPQFESQRFVYCELFPEDLALGDAAAYSMSYAFSATEFQEEVSQDTKKLVSSNVVERSDEIETRPIRNLDNCAKNPRYIGDNLPIVDEVTGAVTWKEKCYENYCGEGTNVQCPGEVRSVSKLEPEASQREIEPAHEGGGILFSFIQGLGQGAFAPKEAKNFEQMEENDNEYLCNLQGKDNSDPELCKFSREDEILANRKDPDANCDPNVPDSEIPPQYRGSFKQNVVRLCNNWSNRGKSNGERCYNDVVKQAGENGINPAFALSVWMNESACSNYTRSTTPVEDFGIHTGAYSKPEDFQIQIRGFFNTVGDISKDNSPKPQCYHSGWSEFEAFMFVYMYGGTYENFPGNGVQYPSLDGKSCTDPYFMNGGDYWSYYHAIRDGAWSWITEGVCSGFISDPSDNSCP